MNEVKRFFVVSLSPLRHFLIILYYYNGRFALKTMDTTDADFSALCLLAAAHCDLTLFTNNNV